MTESDRFSRRKCLQIMGGAATAAVAVVLPQKAPAAAPGVPAKANGAHRIMSCNILLDLPEHAGNESWKKHRREACMTVIHARNPDIICLQEVGPGQLVDFEKAFPGFGSFGFIDPASDKNPPRFKSIRNVIFYDRGRYDLISQSKYWLSETPLLAASKFESVGMGRHVSWVRLKDRNSGREFRMLDTHFSLTPPIRQLEADILVKEAAQYLPDFPQLVAGDFNAEKPTAEIQTLLKSGWKDTYEAASQAEQDKPKRKIDYIFYKGAVKPLNAEIFWETPKGIHPSDHPFFRTDVMLG